MSETDVKIRGYVDPRTGEYKWATEANRDEVLEDMGFMLAGSSIGTGRRQTISSPSTTARRGLTQSAGAPG